MHYDAPAVISRSANRKRGDDQQTRHLFSYLSLEQRVPVDLRLRPIRTMTDGTLRRMVSLAQGR
jgi:hypothetical protein